MKLPNKVYDIFKWVIVAIIAAVNTHDPAAIVTAVFGGLSTLAGIVIKISDGEYQKELNGGK